MDINEYMAVWLFRERIAEAEASAARGVRVGLHLSPRRLMRLRLGQTRVRLGHWILGPVAEYSGQAPCLLCPGAVGKPDRP
jgi:hypothetical protein